jgi:SsrA-binding protein
MRARKLLLHKKEILKLFGLVGREGYSIIPLALYFKGPCAKMEIGLCRGKKLYDKRDSAARKDMDRQSMRNVKIVGRLDD